MKDSFAIQELGIALATLERRVVAGFDQLNGRISAMESKVGTRIDDVEAHADKRSVEFHTRVDTVSAKFKQVRYSLEGLEERLAQRVERLDTEVRKQLDVLQAAVDAIGAHFASSKPGSSRQVATKQPEPQAPGDMRTRPRPGRMTEYTTNYNIL